MEDRLLANQLAGSPNLNQPSILPLISHRPRIMTCPLGWEGESNVPTVPPGHYGFTRIYPNENRRLKPDGFELFDVPLKTRIAWAQSPEEEIPSLRYDEGPHAGGYHIADQNGGVSFVEGPAK